MTKQRKRSRGNGEGSIVKLGGKRKRPYAARITVGWTNEGRQMFKYVGYYENKTAAKQALSQYFVNPYDLSVVKTTAQEVFDLWSKTTSISDAVVKAYKGVFDKTGFAKRTFSEIKLIELEAKGKELSPAMQKRYKALFKNLYNYAMKADIANKNLADLMDLDKYVAGKREAIDLSDVKVVLKGDDNIAKILLYTGMRISELIEIKSANVFLDKRYMIGGKKTAAGINRVIPLHQEILPIIKEFLDKGANYLITDDKNKKISYNTYLNTWKSNPILKSVSPHFARHTFISRAVTCGIQKVFIQNIVGHSNESITDHYTHLSKEQLIEAIDKFRY